jgi:hypothetical protein
VFAHQEQQQPAAHRILDQALTAAEEQPTRLSGVEPHAQTRYRFA